MKKNLFCLLTMAFSLGVSTLGLAQTAPNPGDQTPDFSIFQGFAEAFQPTAARIISDPLYLPLQGQLYGATSYTYGHPTYDTLNNKGVETATVKDDDNTWAQTLEYGITNDLTVRLLDSYEYNTTNTNSLFHDTTTTNQGRDFTNPTIGATYRALDQVSYPVDVDLTANYSPNLVRELVGNDGTVASGRNEVALTMGVGREMNMLSIEGVAGATYLGDESYDSLTNDTTHSVKNSWEYTYGLDTETRLTSRFSINLNANYTLGTHSFSDNITTGVNDLMIPPNTWAYTAALNYQIIPDKLVAGLTYTYDLFSHGKSIFPNPNSDTETINHDSNVFGVRLQYVFF